MLVSISSFLPSCQSGASHLTAFKDCPAEIEENGNFYMMQSGGPGDLKSELVPRFTQESKQRQNREPGPKTRREGKERGKTSELEKGCIKRTKGKATQWTLPTFCMCLLKGLGS